MRGDVGRLRALSSRIFRKSGVPDIAARPQTGDRLELLLGIARAGGDDRAAERMRAALHDVAARRQMVGEAVQHDVARAKARRAASAGAAPHGSVAMRLRLEDRPRRGQQALERRRRVAASPPNGGAAACTALQVGLAQHRNAREIGAGSAATRVDALELRASRGDSGAEFGRGGGEDLAAASQRR